MREEVNRSMFINQQHIIIYLFRQPHTQEENTINALTQYEAVVCLLTNNGYNTICNLLI